MLIFSGQSAIHSTPDTGGKYIYIYIYIYNIIILLMWVSRLIHTSALKVLSSGYKTLKLYETSPPKMVKLMYSP